MITVEPKYERFQRGEEVTLTIEEYVRWRNIPAIVLRPDILKKYLYEKRELWTKRDDVEIIYDIIYEK